MRVAAAAVFALLIATPAYAQLGGTPFGGDWQQASNTGQARTADYRWIRCFYQTLSGMRFAVNVQSMTCPFSVEYNPGTQQVR